MSTNATCGSCRQAGEKLFLKGAKCRSPKCTFEKRSTTPGQHGKKAGTKKSSEYGQQLQEKKKVKLMYGVLEKQFRRFFEIATRQRAGTTGENLLSLLERRLDNVLYRLKMAISRIQARQMIVHGHICVNGERVTVPSYLVQINDTVSFAESTLNNKTFMESIVDKRINSTVKVPDWLDLQKKDRKGVILRLPIRADVTLPIEEHLIVEFYSK